jgi:hypothetical protein
MECLTGKRQSKRQNKLAGDSPHSVPFKILKLMQKSRLRDQYQPDITGTIAAAMPSTICQNIR